MGFSFTLLCNYLEASDTNFNQFDICGEAPGATKFDKIHLKIISCELRIQTVRPSIRAKNKYYMDVMEYRNTQFGIRF